MSFQNIFFFDSIDYAHILSLLYLKMNFNQNISF